MATNKLLFDESPLVIQPTLAKAIGLNEAIILQQIHYWLKKSKDGWVYNTYDEWKEQFPFFSEATIKRTITKLKKSGVLIVSQNKKSTWDRVNHYQIDYEIMSSLIESDCTHRTGQNDLIDNSKMTSSSYSTETTAENTSDTISKPKAKPIHKKEKGTPEKPYDVSLDLWNDFIKQRKNKLTDSALKLIIGQAEKANITLEQALEETVLRGWQSFKADWYQKGNSNQRLTGSDF